MVKHTQTIRRQIATWILLPEWNCPKLSSGKSMLLFSHTCQVFTSIVITWYPSIPLGIPLPLPRSTPSSFSVVCFGWSIMVDGSTGWILMSVDTFYEYHRNVFKNQTQNQSGSSRTVHRLSMYLMRNALISLNLFLLEKKLDSTVFRWFCEL